MRHIGELEKQGQAEAFASYLLVQGIESQLDPQDTCIEVWIKDEDHFDRARKELEQFKSRPDDPKYAQAVASKTSSSTPSHVFTASSTD